jgi:hypothetical protein
MPQYYDTGVKKCEFKKVENRTMFVQPLMPDGIVFAFRDKVRTQLLCSNNQLVGKAGTLIGTGMLYIPAGCQMTITNAQKEILQVKGLPVAQVISASNVKLIKHNITAIRQVMESNGTIDNSKLVQLEHMVQGKLDVIQTEIDKVEELIDKQEYNVWILAIAVLTSAIVFMIVITLLYRYSSRVRRMVETIRRKLMTFEDLPKTIMAEVVKKLKELEAKMKDPMQKSPAKERWFDEGAKNGEPASPPSPEDMKRRKMGGFKSFRKRSRDRVGSQLGNLETMGYKPLKMMGLRPVDQKLPGGEVSPDETPVIEPLRLLHRSPRVTFDLNRTEVRYKPESDSPSEEDVAGTRKVSKGYLAKTE